jgi:HSP20 family protein
VVYRSLIPYSFRRNTDPFNWIRREIEHLFDNIGQTSGLGSHLIASEKVAALVPDIDVSENDKEVTVAAELPGLEKNNITIEFNDHVLTLRGEKKLTREEKKEDYFIAERASGTFVRSVYIPAQIDEEHIEATFDKGVLTIKLPKTREAKAQTKRIEVKNA